MAQSDNFMPGEWDSQGTLFGGGTFTDAYKKSKEDAYLNEALAMSQMDPRDAHVYSQGKLNRSVINSVTGIFGDKGQIDPELKKANDMDSIYKSLSEEDLKNPVIAYSKAADQLGALGHTKEALAMRMQSEKLAQDTVTRKNSTDMANLKQSEAVAKAVGSLANGTLEAFRTVGDKEELKQQFWDSYVDKYEKLAGKEEADKLRALSKEAREAQLNKDINAAESSATTSMEQRQLKQLEASKNNAIISASAVTTGAATRAQAALKAKNLELSYKFANLSFRKSVEGRKAMSDQIASSQDSVKEMNNSIEEIDKSLDNFRSKINFAGEDKAAVQANISILESQKARLLTTRAETEKEIAGFMGQFQDIVAYNVDQGQPSQQPTTKLSLSQEEIHKEWLTYQSLWFAAKGNPKEQTRLTALARTHGIVK